MMTPEEHRLADLERDRLLSVNTPVPSKPSPQTLQFPKPEITTVADLIRERDQLRAEVERLKGSPVKGKHGSCWSEIDALKEKLRVTELQIESLRKALLAAPVDHYPHCITINKHPYPELEYCKCWIKLRAEALKGSE